MSDVNTIGRLSTEENLLSFLLNFSTLVYAFILLVSFLSADLKLRLDLIMKFNM